MATLAKPKYLQTQTPNPKSVLPLYHNKAQLFWDDMDFQAFEEVLDLLIYGLVLFPNPDSFVDVNAIKIFLSRNPMPTLLGDILHSIDIYKLIRIWEQHQPIDKECHNFFKGL